MGEDMGLRREGGWRIVLAWRGELLISKNRRVGVVGILGGWKTNWRSGSCCGMGVGVWEAYARGVLCGAQQVHVVNQHC